MTCCTVGSPQTTSMPMAVSTRQPSNCAVKPDPSISFDLARLTAPAKSLAGANRPGFRLGTLIASLPRSIGLVVRHDPLPDNRAHSLIEGENTKAGCRQLAAGTILVEI